MLRFSSSGRRQTRKPRKPDPSAPRRKAFVTSIFAEAKAAIPGDTDEAKLAEIRALTPDQADAAALAEYEAAMASHNKYEAEQEAAAGKFESHHQPFPGSAISCIALNGSYSPSLAPRARAR
jgi:hypothetical protein